MPKRSQAYRWTIDENGNAIFDTTKFATENEAKVFSQIEKNSFVPERGLRLEPPQLPYIEKYGWQRFVKTPTILADKTLVREFYANLGNYHDHHTVTVRGKKVDFSPKTINAMFGLKNYQKDGFTKFLEAPLNHQEVFKGLTGGELDLPTDWKKISRHHLTTTARLWYGFVLARLMPSTMNSRVQRWRALLTYALVSNRSIDVGAQINQEIYIFLQPKELHHALRFPVIITMLCRLAGVETDFQGGVFSSQSLLCIKIFEKEKEKENAKRTGTPRTDGAGPSSQATTSTRAPPQDPFATLEARMARMVQLHVQSQEAIRRLEQRVEQGLAANSQAIHEGFTAMNQRLDTFFASFSSLPPGPNPSLP